ncbi:signal recognition particle 9 kda protein [Moniliophthora roreri MCA 2997]|uniref:Signal recognition particle 9 kDa protein n=2 Tax=Moniliophthora roreri TaxID=221103 RepID=V2X8T1_MONRO|nr:signal recognition particle 9 kda protein [Moniliophthora roreri MCA 2997]KAI3609796.1 signal recognition particle 9 kda protein [Moniliophthora roreri]
MVYFQSWHEFQDAAEALHKNSPQNTRYVVKWRACEGKLVLKVTDDVKCLKFKTYSSIYLNRFEALNLSLMEKMQNRRAVEPQSANVDTPRDSPIPGAVSSVAVTQAAPAAGVKKKKATKKKKGN